LAFSAKALAFSTSSNFFFSTTIRVFEEANWSSTLRNSSLWLSTCFSTFSRVAAAYFLSFSSSCSLFLEALIGHLKDLHDGDTPSFLFLHLPMAVIGHIFCPEGGLNSLPRKETRIRERG